MAIHAFAVVAPGLEPLVIGELGDLGITGLAAEHGGIAFDATEATLAASLLALRTASRVLVRAAEFRATSFAQLEQRANAIPWATWVAPGARVRFRVTCRKSRLYHSDAVAERLAAAVTGKIRGAQVVGGSADEDESDHTAQLFVVRLADNVCTVSADAAGDPLHRRGYRLAVAKAPLRETLAAAMLLGAGWDATTALYDPMCGSGTLVIEAAWMARRIAPGLHRTFAAERWPSARAKTWHDVRARANDQVLPAALVSLTGSDRDAGAIAAAIANAERAGVAGDVTFTKAAISAARAPAPAGLFVTNPPYGVRVGDTAALRDLYAQYGNVARKHFAGWRCAILSADKGLERQTGLALRERWKSSNGGIDVRLVST